MWPQKDSKFAAAYAAGIHKSKYWEVVYEDSMDLVAKLPQLAAMVYRRTYKGRDYIAPDAKLDWAANLSHMMGGSKRDGVAGMQARLDPGACTHLRHACT